MKNIDFKLMKIKAIFSDLQVAITDLELELDCMKFLGLAPYDDKTAECGSTIYAFWLMENYGDENVVKKINELTGGNKK